MIFNFKLKLIFYIKIEIRDYQYEELFLYYCNYNEFQLIIFVEFIVLFIIFIQFL